MNATARTAGSLMGRLAFFGTMLFMLVYGLCQLLFLPLAIIALLVWIF